MSQEIILPIEVKNSIESKFKDYEDIAKEWNSKAYEIEVTDESQIELMEQAKQGRLLLKYKRIEIEKTRVRLKEQSLLEGRFIDSLAKRLKDIIEPAEKHLNFQEKFAELKEQERKEKLKNDRLESLTPYIDFADLSAFDLRTMSDVAFNTILNGCRIAYEEDKKQKEENRKQEEIQLKKINLFGERKSKIAPYLFYQKKYDTILTIDTTESQFQKMLFSLSERKLQDDAEKKALAESNAELQKKVVKSELEILKQEHTNMKNTLEKTLNYILPDDLRKIIESTLKSLK